MERKIMTLEAQVCAVELSQRLKKLGVKQKCAELLADEIIKILGIGNYE